jgi:hypothetical protein
MVVKMEKVIQELDPTDVTKAKKVVDRSAAYPSITIEDAVAFSQSVVKSFPKEGTLITREDIATVLKKPSSSSVQREVATCAQYGLFIKDKEGYKISSKAKLLNNQFIPNVERSKIFLDCFRSPKLYKDIIQNFDGHSIPSELPYILVRSHQISDKAAPEAARIFLANAAFCRVLDENGVLNVEGKDAGEYIEVIEQKIAPPSAQIIDLVQKEPQNLLATKQVDEAHDVIRISNKRVVTLIYPDEINKKDLDIIRKHLDTIEFRITDS